MYLHTVGIVANAGMRIFNLTEYACALPDPCIPDVAWIITGGISSQLARPSPWAMAGHILANRRISLNKMPEAEILSTSG